MTTAFLSRRCRGSREVYRCVTSGRFLNGGGAAIAACTDTTIHLLVAQEGSLDGEGQLDVVCEQPLFATSRTVARLPGTVADEQDCLALLTDSGHVTILRFDANSTRLVIVQQLPLPPEEPGDPFSLLAVHPHGSALAVAARSGALCLAVRQEAHLAGVGAPLFLSPCLQSVDSPVCGLAFVQGCADEEATAAAAVQDASTACAAAASQLFSLAVLLWRRRPSRCILVEVGLQCSTLLDAGQPGSAVSCLAYARRLGGSTEGGSDMGGPPRALLQLPPPPQSQPGSGDSSLQHIQGGASLSTRAACVLLQHRQAEVAAASAAGDPKLQPSGQLATAGSGPEFGLREVQGEAESMDLDGGGLAGAGPQSQQGAQVAAAAAGEADGASGVCPPTEAAEHHLNACETPSNEAAASNSGGDNDSSSDSEIDSELHSRSDGGSQSGSDSGGGGGGMASPEPSQPSSAGFTACCCWEWQEAAAAGEGGPLSTTLLCQLESGSFCELAVPYVLGATTCCFGAPSCQSDASEATALPHSQLAQPARGMCSLPGQLLVVCTAAGGLLLLRRRPAPTTTSGTAASVASSQPASWVAVRYKPLLPSYLAATQQQQQQQLQPAECTASAATAGCASCTVPPAAPVVDCQLADLEGAGQPQLYSLCLTADGTEGGSLCTFYADPKPETAFELPGAAEGITGLWGLRRSSRDPHHSLVLLSYVGGSRLLAALDGVFRDVSESHPLKADAQTLAAGNLSVPAASGALGAGAGLTVVAQVTSQGVMLICPAACPSPDAAAAAAAAAAGWADSPNEMSEEPPSRGGSYAWQPPPGSSVGAAAVADGLVLLFCTGGSSRHVVALVPAVAAGVAAVSAAAAAAGSAAVGATPTGEGLSSASVQPQQGSLVLVEIGALPVAAELSCISGVLRQGPQHGSEGCTAVFAAGTYSSSVLLVQLQLDSQQQQGGRLQLLHTIDLTRTSAATLPPATALAAAATPLSPRSYQREQLTPESLLLLPAAASDSCGHDASGGGAAWLGAATVVVGLRTGGLLQLACSWGLTEKQQQQQQGLQQQWGEEEELLFLTLGTMPVVLLPLPPHQPSAAAAAAGLLPPTAAALSDRVSVLHHRPPAGPRAGAAGGSSLWGGRVRCQQLALPHVQAAAALLLDSSGNSGGPLLDGAMAVDGEAEHREDQAHKQPAQRPQQQLFLLCAATDGCLRMVSLEPAQLTSCRSWPLPQQLQPSRLAVHQASGSVAVAGTCQSPHWLWGDDADVSEEWRQAAVFVLDPQTGDQLASYRGFRPGEAVTALTVWDPPSHAQELLQQQLHQRQRQQHEQERKRERQQACGPASRGSGPDGPAGVAAGAAVGAAAVRAGGSPAAAASGSNDLQFHPVAIAPDSPLGASSSGEVSVGQTAAAAAAAGDEHPWGGFLVVGTSIDGSMEGGLPGEPEEWEDETSTRLQGRLLLLQLAAATSASGGGSRAAAAWREAAAACEGEQQQQQQQPRRPLQLIAVAELHLPSRVTALCPGGRQLTGLKPLSSSSGSSSSGGGGDTSSRLFAAVGRRVVSFEWQQRQQLLRRVAWLPTMRAITSLRVSGGFLAAADPYEGATLYRYLDFPPGTPRSAMRAVGRLYRAQRQNVAGLELPRLALGPAPLGDEAEVAARIAGAAGGVGPAARDGIRVVVDGNGEEYGFHAVATDCACRAAVGAVALPSAPTTSSATVSGSGGNGGNPSAAAASAQRESAPLAAAVLDAAGQLSLLQQLWPAVESTMSQRCSHSFREPAATLLPGSFAYRGEAGAGSAGPGARPAVPSRGEEEQAGAAAAEAAMVAVTDSGAAVTLLPLAQRHASQLQQLQQALEQHPATAPLCGGTLAAFHGSRQGKRLFCHPPPAAASAAAAAQPPLPPSAATPNGAGGLGGGSLLVTEAAAAPDGEARPAHVAPSQPSTPVSSPRLQLPVLQPPEEQLHAVLDAELLQQYLLLSPREQRQLVAAHFPSCDGSQAAACSLAIQLTNLVARLLM